MQRDTSTRQSIPYRIRALASVVCENNSAAFLVCLVNFYHVQSSRTTEPDEGKPSKRAVCTVSVSFWFRRTVHVFFRSFRSSSWRWKRPYVCYSLKIRWLLCTVSPPNLTAHFLAWRQGGRNGVTASCFVSEASGISPVSINHVDDTVTIAAKKKQ